MATPPQASVLCEGVLIGERRFQQTFTAETTVEEVIRVIKDIFQQTHSKGDAPVIDPKCDVVCRPSVPNPSQTRLSELQDRLEVIFTPYHASAAWTTASEVDIYRHFVVPRLSADASRVEARRVQDVDALQSNIDNLQLQVGIILQRLQESDERLKKGEEERQYCAQKIQEAEETIQQLGTTLEQERVARADLERSAELKGKELKEKVDLLDRSVKEGRALARIIYPILLRILMDDARGKIAEILGFPSWFDLVQAAGTTDLWTVVKRNAAVKISYSTFSLIQHGKHFRTEGNHYAHNASPDMVDLAVGALPVGDDRTAFEDMYKFVYPPPLTPPNANT